MYPCKEIETLRKEIHHHFRNSRYPQVKLASHRELHERFPRVDIAYIQEALVCLSKPSFTLWNEGFPELNIPSRKKLNSLL